MPTLCYHTNSATHLESRVSGHSMVDMAYLAQKAALAVTYLWDSAYWLYIGKSGVHSICSHLTFDHYPPSFEIDPLRV